MQSEKTIERKLNAHVKSLGGLSLKLLPFFHKGLPDRLILLPFGRAYFVEVKSEGKKASAIQERVHTFLRELGFTVLLIDNEKQIWENLK